MITTIVCAAGVAILSPNATLVQGVYGGEIVNEFKVTVGFMAKPDAGAVSVRGPGLVFDWIASQRDSNADGFVNGNDLDLWMEWWVLGSPMADWDGNGFVNADDFDAHAETEVTTWLTVFDGATA